MPTRAIISYDDTLNDHDALALGRLLASAGAELTLAYVRHTTLVERAREELEEHEAAALLERGARWLQEFNVDTRVVVSASTGTGLAWLAEQEGADVVVFGSDYRTAAGHIAPQSSAQRLLEGGATAVGLAPANFRAVRGPRLTSIGVLPGPGDDSALRTAQELGERVGAVLTTATVGVDLLVVGSRSEAPQGRVMVTAQAQNTIEAATAPVIVLPRGVALSFPNPVTTA